MMIAVPRTVTYGNHQDVSNEDCDKVMVVTGTRPMTVMVVTKTVTYY